jgi:hypothetical protein
MLCTKALTALPDQELRTRGAQANQTQRDEASLRRLAHALERALEAHALEALSEHISSRVVEESV